MSGAVIDSERTARLNDWDVRRWGLPVWQWRRPASGRCPRPINRGCARPLAGLEFFPCPDR